MSGPPFLGDVLALTGAAFFPYLVQRGVVARWAEWGEKDHPTDLFITSLISGLIFGLVFLLLFGILAVLAGIGAAVMSSQKPWPIAQANQALLPGFLRLFNIGWFFLLVKYARTIETGDEGPLKYPPARLQFRTSDLLSATIIFGVVMLAGQSIGRNDASIRVPVLVYLFVTQAAGFALALDVCRHGEKLNDGWRRFFAFGFLMFLCAIPQSFVLVVMSWNAWRYALSRCRAAEG